MGVGLGRLKKLGGMGLLLFTPLVSDLVQERPTNGVAISAWALTRFAISGQKAAWTVNSCLWDVFRR